MTFVDASALTAVLLVPLSRRLTHEIIHFGARDDSPPAPSLSAGLKALWSRVHRMWQDPLLTLPVIAEAALPVLVEALAGWVILRGFGVTGGAKRQLGLVAFRLLALSVMTPLVLLRKRLSLRPLIEEGALETVDVTAADVQVQPIKQDVRGDLTQVFDDVMGPEPLELSWRRLRPLYTGVEVDVLRIVGGAAVSFVGWKAVERMERKRRFRWDARWKW